MSAEPVRVSDAEEVAESNCQEIMLMPSSEIDCEKVAPPLRSRKETERGPGRLLKRTRTEEKEPAIGEA